MSTADITEDACPNGGSVPGEGFNDRINLIYSTHTGLFTSVTAKYTTMSPALCDRFQNRLKAWMRDDDAGLSRVVSLGVVFSCPILVTRPAYPREDLAVSRDVLHIAYHHNLPIITVWPNTRPNITSRPTAAHGMQSWPRSSSGILETS